MSLLRLHLSSKQMAIYIFMIYYCFLFVFQTVIPFYVGMAFVMLAIPILMCKQSIKFKWYTIPIILLYVIILLWSTEPHKSFVYFFILIEAIVLIQPDEKDMR